ncbi:MAG: hypothetical protein Q9180_002134 [Flavoplaca navasiana]
MPSATSPPKSILKPSSAIEKNSPIPSSLSREERNRHLALHHANLIQYRKDIESLIHTSIETLIELPTPLNASPLEIDRHTVKEALKPFQPLDYDALIEERNINHKCGYVLCRNGNRKQDTPSKYRIVAGKDFRVVASKESEKWCSDQCRRMALYLRVQLNEEPAWTREWEAGGPLELYDERVQPSEIRNSEGPALQPSMVLEGSKAQPNMAMRMKDLAVERGDKNATVKASSRVAVDVKENIRTEQEMPVPPNAENTHADSIEGYIPNRKHISEWTAGHDEDAEDLMPTS